MGPLVVSHRAATGALLALLVVLTPGGAAGDVLVEITAPADRGPTAFVLVCDGALTRDVTPARLGFAGPALDCALRADGPLAVVARSDGGSVARSRTSGGLVRFSLR